MKLFRKVYLIGFVFLLVLPSSVFSKEVITVSPTLEEKLPTLTKKVTEKKKLPETPATPEDEQLSVEQPVVPPERVLKSIAEIKAITPDVELQDLESLTVEGEELSFDINIPRIGTFVLKGKIDLLAMRYNFTGTLKELKKIEIGPLTINPPKATFSSKFGLQLEGSATLFNKYDLIVKLEKFIPGQDLLFSLGASHPIIIPLTPWKKISVKKLYLSLGRDKQRIFTQLSLFARDDKKDTELSVGLDKLNPFVELKISEIRPSGIIPLFKKTILNKIVTKNVLMRVSKMFTNPTLKLSGTTDFSAFGESLPVKLDLADLSTTFKVSAKGDVTLNARMAEEKSIKPFKGIPILKEIELSDLGLGFDLKSMRLFLEGACSILGIPTRGQLDVSPKGIILKAFLEENWNISNIFPQARETFLNDMRMMNGYFVLSTRRYFDEDLGVQITKGINLLADLPFWDFILGFVKNEKALKILKHMPPFVLVPDRVKLFGTVGLSLEDLKLELILTKKQVEILNIPNGPVLKSGNIALYVVGDGPTVGGKAELILKPLPTDEPLVFAASLELNRLMLDISGSMAGRWNNPLGIATLLGLKKDKLAIEDVGLEIGFDLKKLLGLLMTAAGATGTAAGATGTTAGAAGTAAGVGVSATGVGAAVGAPGAGVAGVGTVGVGAVTGAGTAGTALSAAGTLTSWLAIVNNFGITGGLKIGDAVAKVGLQLSTDIDNLTLIAKLIREVTDPQTGVVKNEMIRFRDLVHFAKDLGIPIPAKFINALEKMGTLGIMGELYLCPFGTRIGQVTIDPGITFTGQISIPNMFRIIDPKQSKSIFGKIKLSISMDGLIAKGGLSKIKIGNFFQITGKGFDRKLGSGDDGPTLSFELSLRKQEFFVSGIMDVLSNIGPLRVDGQIEIRFDLEKVRFFTEAKLFGKKVKVGLNAESVGDNLMSIQDFKVHGEFKDDFTTLLMKKIKELMVAGRDKTKYALQQKEIMLEKKIAKVKKLEAEVAKLYKERMKGRGGKLIIKMREAQKKVDTLEDRIDKLEEERDKVDFSFRTAPFYLAKKAALTAKIAGLWAAHEIAIGALQVAKLAVAAVTGNLDAEITAKETLLYAARQAFRLVRDVVESAREVLTDAEDAAIIAVKDLNKSFKLHKATLDFSFVELFKKSLFPKITIDATVMGRKVAGSIQADFNKPAKVFKDIYKIIKKFFRRPQIKDVKKVLKRPPNESPRLRGVTLLAASGEVSRLNRTFYLLICTPQLSYKKTDYEASFGELFPKRLKNF